MDRKTFRELFKEIKMKHNYIYFFIVLVIGFSELVWADFSVKKIGDSVVDSAALTLGDAEFGKAKYGKSINGVSFQQDAVVSHEGYQYVGYYDGNRQVCIARRELPSGAWETIRFKDYHFSNNDAHNTISIGICPGDGTIHIAFDHHGNPLHYRVSRKGVATNPGAIKWEASLFGSILSELEEGKKIKITYPRFWQTPGGGLQFCYRQGGSGNGDRMLVDYDPLTGLWANTRQIDSSKEHFQDEVGTSDSRCSYPNGYTYGPKGRLHATWVWRESSQGANHDLMYAYSEDRGKTWRNNADAVIDGPPHVNSQDITVAKISRAYGLMNTQAQSVDSTGRIHAVMWHCTDASIKAAGAKPGDLRWGPEDGQRYHHYWRDDNGTWQHSELPGKAGNRPKLFFDKNDNAYLIFGRKITAKKIYSGILFPEGDLVIMAATAHSSWTDWKVIHIEKGSFVNEMLGDVYRWNKSDVLSVMVQESPEQNHDPTSLRIIDFQVR